MPYVHVPYHIIPYHRKHTMFAHKFVFVVAQENTYSPHRGGQMGALNVGFEQRSFDSCCGTNRQQLIDQHCTV